jgi:hypothetical protein
VARRLIIPDPDFMGWTDWLDQVIGLNGVIPGGAASGEGDDWKGFSDRLSLFVPDTPYGEDFETWQEWARALRSSLSL